MKVPARAQRVTLVETREIRAAITALEADAASGVISDEEAHARINNCRRAVTPRELWKASGGRAGAKKRSDWHDIRRTVFAVFLLLTLAVIGVWIVTIYTGKFAGDGNYIPDVTPSVSVPAQSPPP